MSLDFEAFLGLNLGFFGLFWALAFGLIKAPSLAEGVGGGYFENVSNFFGISFEFYVFLNFCFEFFGLC